MAYAQVMAMSGANSCGTTVSYCLTMYNPLMAAKQLRLQKKVTMSAGLFVSYSVANMVALVAYQDDQAPGCQYLDRHTANFG